MTTAKAKAERRGRWAEVAAIVFLSAKGYRIVARRVRTPVGEIDLIARKGRVTACIEVKYRKTLDAAKESITARQRHRIMRAASLWMAQTVVPGQQSDGAMTLRFDAICIAPPLKITHIKSAWTA